MIWVALSDGYSLTLDIAKDKFERDCAYATYNKNWPWVTVNVYGGANNECHINPNHVIMVKELS